MGAKRKSRDRGRKKDRKNRTPKGGRKSEAAEPRVVRHRLFGDIPLVKGGSGAYWSWDMDYKPPLPKGAVRGNVYKQYFCPQCHTPRYFYVDIKRVCRQCDRTFLFSAAEQKYWYETLGFYLDSEAVRCRNCRRQRRSEKALHAQLTAAIEGVREDPDDPAQLLALAEFTVHLRQRTGQGDLNRGIAAARRAYKRWDQAHEALLWEAALHQLAGRPDRARERAESFLERATSRRLRRLRQNAEDLVRESARALST